jgi:hypothetical protein
VNAARRRWLSTALAAGLMLSLVLIVAFDDLNSVEPPRTVVLREVQTYEPPPPPPPPPPAPLREAGSPGPSVMLASRTEPVVLKTMDVDVALPTVGVSSIAAGGGGFGAAFGKGSGSDLGLVSLSELDELPRVVSAPPFPFPKEAVEQGLKRFRVMFHILIDEQGRTYPVEIVENPLPSLQKELEQFASEVRFSPPTRLGVPVRTEYLWPVLFSHP